MRSRAWSDGGRKRDGGIMYSRAKGLCLNVESIATILYGEMGPQDQCFSETPLLYFFKKKLIYVS